MENNPGKKIQTHYTPQFVSKAICKQIRNNGLLDCLSHDENPSPPLIAPISPLASGKVKIEYRLENTKTATSMQYIKFKL